MRWDVWVVVPLVAFAALTGFARPWQDPAERPDEERPVLHEPDPPTPEPVQAPVALLDPGPHGEPFVRGDLRRTGDHPGVALPDKVRIAWEVADWTQAAAAPGIVGRNGTHYGQTEDGDLAAVSSDGEVIWRHRVDGRREVAAGPAVGDTLVFFGARDGRLHAAATATGLRQWTAPLGGSATGSPLLHADLLHVATARGDTGTLHAYSLRGAPVWRAPLEASPTDIAIDPALGLLLIGDEAGTLQAWDAATGRRVWAVDVGAPVQGAPALADGAAFVAAGDKVLRVGLDGVIAWNRTIGGQAGAGPSVGHTAAQVYVGDIEGFVHAFDARDGTMHWRVGADAPIRVPPVPVAGGVLAGSGEALYAISDAGRVAWSIDLGGPVAGVPWVEDGRIIVATGATADAQGALYALGAT